MLARIRRALGRSPEAPSSPSLPAMSPLEAAVPKIAPADLVPRFEAELNKVGGRTFRVSTAIELHQFLAKLLASLQSDISGDQSGVVLSRNPLLVRLGLFNALGRASANLELWPEVSPPQPSSDNENQESKSDLFGPDLPESVRSTFKEQCFRAAMGITGVDFVLAESGTLVLSSATEGTQLTSLAPPLHVALYRRQQVLASLEDVLERMQPAANGAMSGRSIVLITGTSRTADIEQILVRGVHGPREVHAILIEDSCLI
jgi:L-lactate utilization protein LutC